VAIIHGHPDSDKPKRPQGSRGYRGKKGEERVLKKLKELDDSFHILCNVKLGSNPFSQNSKRDAQIDFVIVSKRGIVSMEVKNWSDEHYAQRKKYGYTEPHLQTDRAGKKLWADLHFSFTCNIKNPPVTRVLLGTYGNLQHNPQFDFVNVKDLTNINNFLQNQTEKLSEDKVHYVVDHLLIYVPNSKYDFRKKRS